jgi:hypothetical protein
MAPYGVGQSPYFGNQIINAKTGRSWASRSFLKVVVGNCSTCSMRHAPESILSVTLQCHGCTAGLAAAALRMQQRNHHQRMVNLITLEF